MELLILNPHRIMDLEQVTASVLPITKEGSLVKSFICVTPELEVKVLTVFRHMNHSFRPATEVPDFVTAVSIFSLLSSSELMRFLSGHSTLPDYVPWVVMYILKVRGL
jgi:hypothetical protein